MCVEMVTNVESDKAREERLKSMIHFEEKEKTNEAMLTGLEGRVFGIFMLPYVQQCTCIFYSSHYCTAVAIFIQHT